MVVDQGCLLSHLLVDSYQGVIIEVDPADALAPGVTAEAALLTVDFDLAASHEVFMEEDPVRVAVEPFLVAEVEEDLEGFLEALAGQADKSQGRRVRGARA